MFRGKEDKKEDKISERRKQALFLKIKPIIAKELQIDEGKIALTSKIASDLGADSLDAIEIVMALEEEFNIEIVDAEADKMKTVDDIVVYLAERIKE